ncbi:MAG: acyl-CoA dehydrogenase family protein [Phycisphaeraceae bacterium]
MPSVAVANRDLKHLIERAESISAEVIDAEATAVDREGRWPERGLRALQEARLGGLVVPESAGGLGHGLFAVARICETLGRYCASTGLCFGMHCVGTAVIAAKVTADQQDRYLEPIVRGEHLTTLALSEPGTGSHFYMPEAALTRLDDHSYRLTGVKSFVTNGGHADSYVVSATGGETDAPAGHFSCVVVPASSEGLKWGSSWDGLGMRGNSSRTMEMDAVRVPQENLLGREGDQTWYVFQVVAPYFLVAMAGTYLGVAEAAFDEAKAHIQRRQHTHTGRALAQQPIVQQRLGAMWAQLERTRQLIYHAAREGDAGGANALLALLSAKAEVADCVVGVVNEAMNLCGGSAYRSGARLERCLRDGRAADVMAPTTDILRLWTGRALLEQPLLGD